MIVDERKENVSTSSSDKNLYHSIHFFGSLVQSAPDREKTNAQSNWRPKSTLEDAVDRELISPRSMASLSASILSEPSFNTTRHNSNILSIGASTISTQENFSKSVIAANAICLTIVTITNLLQKIAIELELLCQDPESMTASDYIPRLYIQYVFIYL